MKGKTLVKYLSEIKSKCDVIVVSSLTLFTKDIILYTRNGLPLVYQAFKIVIRTNLKQIDLENFYALLCSREMNIQAVAIKEISPTNEQ